MTDEAIFHAALAKPPEERNAYLDQACGGDTPLRRQVDILLNAHLNPGSFLANPAVNLPEGPLPETVSAVVTERVGTIVAGRFKLLEQIGEGGMGTIWVAEQAQPVRRKVALKLIKPGMDSKSVLARFEAERQALAMMDHPNIARVLDGGTTESGRPFFVMEYVKGISLTKYCNDTRLSIAERLALFVPICHAVQHAHQKGIIHRDLKPSNILVCLYDGNPVPKVIDFGLAKALHQPLTEHTLHTAHGLMMGTPLYMSPEQAELNNLDVDTRTDIYSLGVILYELLTGTTPLERKQFKEAAYQEMLRLIKEEEPPKPSARLSGSGTLPSLAAQRKLDPVKLTRLVRGELDWIVMKALEKDRGRRYETANGFARDIQRYLADEAVEACPPSAGYRLQKFARKHRAALTMAATIMLLLLAGVAVSTWQAIRATQAEEHAATDRDKALKAEGQAKEQGAEAIKQAKIAKENEFEAKEAVGEKEMALKDLKYNLALDQILISKSAFEGGNVYLAHDRLEQVPPDLRNWEWYYLKRRFNGGIFTLYGPTPKSEFVAGVGVAGVALSPDGTRLATGSWEKTAKIWDARTGTLLLELKGHTLQVTSVAFSPDGTRLLTGSQDKTAKVWDIRTGKQLFELKHSHGVGSVAFSPDGKRLVTGGINYLQGVFPAVDRNVTAKVWDAQTGTLLLDLKGDTGSVTSVAFSPDGTRIATASRSKTAKVWDANTGTPLLELKGHADGVLSVAFSPDGTRLATGSFDNTAKIWDARTGTPLLDLKGKGHTEAVVAVAFSPDGTRLATGSAETLISSGREDNTAKIWDARNGTLLLELKGHALGVLSVAFSPDGTRLVTGSRDRTAKVWDARMGTPRLELKVPFSGSSILAFSPESNRYEPKEPFGGMLSVAFSPESDRLVTASFKTAKVWDARTGTRLLELKGHTANVLSVAFSSDGTRIATSSYDHTAKVWDARTGTLLLDLTGHNDWVCSVAFSPDGTRLVTSSGSPSKKEGPAKVWDARTGALLLDLKGHSHQLRSAAFSPDGMRIATGSLDKTAKIWDARTGAPLLEFKGHTDAVYCVAFSPDGTRLVTGSRDRTAKIWDARTGTSLFDLKGHKATLWSVAFSPDGTRLVTGSLDSTAIVWDARTGTPLLDLKGHTSWVHGVAFSPDGTRLVTGSQDQTAKIWDASRSLQKNDGVLSPEEREYRLFWTRPRPDLHREEYAKAMQAKDTFAARFHVDRLLALNPQDARAHVDLGALLQQNQDLDNAIAEYRRAIELDPKNALAWNNRGISFEKLGQWEKALTDFTKAIELAPKNAQWINQLSWRLATHVDAKIRDSHRALELAKKAVELAPKVGNYWNTLGVAHYRNGNWKSALEALEKSMELSKGGTSTDWLFAAMTHWQLDHKDEARKLYDRAVEWMNAHQPNNEALRGYRAEAAKLLGIKE